jgi:sortase A
MHDGQELGKIAIPRLHLDDALFDGTNEADLLNGPGVYAPDYLPGQGGLVYIAGHRTTHTKPFADINLLRRGDTISIAMPYGTFRYVVTGHRIVLATAVQVLDSHGHEQLILQSCHPKYSATHRYLVYARPATPFRLPRAR